MFRKLEKVSVLIAIGVNLIAILLLFTKASGDKYFIYALDDPYIHLDIAQNLVNDGIYGVNKNEFSSPSSSPIWTFLLAFIIKLFGNHDTIPFYLNILLFPMILILINKLFLNHNIKRFRWILLSFIGLILPIPTLVLSGMEHLLHIILILGLFVKFLQDKIEDRISLIAILILFLIPLVRYESLFFTFILSLAYLKKSNFKVFLLYFLVPFVPVVIFGIYSVSNNYHFFPNSLLLKGSIDFGSLSAIFYFFYYALRKIVEDYSMYNIYILAVISISLSFYFKKFTFNQFLLMGTLIIHSLFSQFGWLFRYEAYIISLSLPIIIITLKSLKDKLSINYKFVIFSLILISAPLFVRAFESFNAARKGIQSINAQHIHFTKFINNYYFGKTIAMNDIGAVGYYNNENYILDLYGLSNIEVADAKRNGYFNNEFIQSTLDKYQPDLIITYRSWFAGPHKIPDNYKLAHQWEVLIHTGLGDYLIDFYVPKSNYNQFIEKMNQFEFTQENIYKRWVDG